MSVEGVQLAMASRYAGDVAPKEAWEGLATSKSAVLVDVRTKAEWDKVGIPDLGDLDKQPLLLSWKLAPTFTVNPNFLTELDAAGVAKDAPVYFLCKVGGRSTDAAIAATSAGWQECYNIENGFEGTPDDQGQGGTINGWKAAGLPWRAV